MFCTQCGNETEEHALYCSKCGTAVAPRKPERDMNMHVTILAWIFIGSGILLGLLATMIIFAGEMIAQLPIPWPPDFPMGLDRLIGSLAVIAGLSTAALAAGVASAGVGLLQFANWGRILTIIMAVFLLFHFPIGTAIAVYAFWVLFSEEGQRFYRSRSMVARREAGA